MNFETRTYGLRDGDDTLVIAEVGVNHNGRPEIARRLVDEAAKAGAHIVKFQAFRSEKEISKFAVKTPYQEETTSASGNQLEMCKALELSGPVLREMKEYCASIGMPFLCAAFDFESVDLLVDDLRVQTIKVPSGEITNLPFLKYIGSKKIGVILSTGASTLAEVGLAVDTLRLAGCPELMLFHCVSSYPAPCDEVNLRVMETMKRAFHLPVGFSDHTLGNAAAITAAALGAAAIEKHFTLDRTMEGPDHRASIEPHEFKAMVEGVRIANQSLGSSVKAPVACELPNLHLIRKSLVASKILVRGTRLTRNMIGIKRPQGGVEPADLEKILGRTLIRDVEEDAPITWGDLA